MKRSRRAFIGAATGLAAAGATGTASAQEGAEMRPDWGGYLEGIDGGYRDARGQDEVTVTVGAAGNSGNFAFAPAGLWVDPGTTVRWEWNGQGGGHNVVAEEGPAPLDSGGTVTEAGVHYEFEFTEEHAGITTYYCAPHRSLGMLGAVAVGDSVPTVQAGTGGGDAAWTPPGGTLGLTMLGLMVGSVAVGVLSVFGAEYYAGRKRRAQREFPPAEEAPRETPAIDIGHDEFDPVGTATLVAVYFLILVLLWAFMYFVEFLGNGPTVIG